MIVLDTTVLVYAVGTSHSLRDPCRRLIEAVSDRRVEASTSAEVIQEFVHVRARRRGRPDAVSLGRDYADLLSPLLPITEEHLRRGLSLFQRADRLGSFDAVLAAAASAADAAAIVSADQAFADLAELPHVVPDEAGIGALLDGS
jgi:uncharacterized protein